MKQVLCLVTVTASRTSGEDKGMGIPARRPRRAGIHVPLRPKAVVCAPVRVCMYGTGTEGLEMFLFCVSCVWHKHGTKGLELPGHVWLERHERVERCYVGVLLVVLLC